MQFPVETVREVAQLLNEANLGEISLESTGDGPPVRLTLRRAAAPVYYAAAAPESGEAAEANLAEPGTPAAGQSVEAPKTLTVTAMAVGVFRAAHPPLEVGNEVKKKQLLAIVEALKIPNEVYAPDAARIVEILATEGQGVEWGQPLMVLEPLETK